MAALLALASALTWGTGDFLGGLAARRVPATAVVLWSHVVGLALMLACAPLAGGELSASALAIGACSGLAGGAGVALLYRALAQGSMSVAAPITALLAAIVPVIVGVASGDRPTIAAGIGVALALVAIAMVSRELADTTAPVGRRVILMALGAGLGFGLFFVIVSAAGDDSGVWPLVGARLASVATFSMLAVAGRVERQLPQRDARRLVVGAGALDAGANVFFVFAVREGLLSVVSVLASLYPAATVVLARAVLKEQLSRLQHAGLALAAVAVALVAA